MSSVVFRDNLAGQVDKYRDAVMLHSKWSVAMPLPPVCRVQLQSDSHAADIQREYYILLTTHDSYTITHGGAEEHYTIVHLKLLFIC